jgi:peroxin-3
VLTTLYSTTLLSLLTVLQLTLLARAKYINSVVQLEREESLREQLEAQFSLRNILFGGGVRLEQLMEEGGLSAEVDGEDDVQQEGATPISEDVESRFLTMSWWILHVGWKDIAERVRRGVEEALDGLVQFLLLCPRGIEY